LRVEANACSAFWFVLKSVKNLTEHILIVEK